MTLVYPRLSRKDANEQFRLLDEEYRTSGAIAPRSNFFHPKLTYPSINAPLLRVNRLNEIRDQLLAALPDRKRLSDAEKKLFDVEAGKTFVRVFEEDGQQQAASEEVWAYLSLVAFPDIALARFRPDGRSGLRPERFLPGRRNVFYVAYLRAWILGDLIDDEDAALLEDELVGLVDRQISTDHRLARMLVRAIASYGGTVNRRESVRAGFKTVRFKQRITDLSAYSDEELEKLVWDVVRESR